MGEPLLPRSAAPASQGGRERVVGLGGRRALWRCLAGGLGQCLMAGCWPSFY